VFNNLGHIIDRELLKQAYHQLGSKKAVGIDRVNKEAYGERLEENITAFTRKIDAAYLGALAHLHMAQIAYLSQDLIEHIKNANNLMGLLQLHHNSFILGKRINHRRQPLIPVPMDGFESLYVKEVIDTLISNTSAFAFSR
jgi:hypothetical protein